jgi:hypothetical protein
MAMKSEMDKVLEEFLARLQKAAGDNLESVILFGSSVSGDYHPKHSNLNVLCILHDTALPRLLALASAARWWTKQKHPAPLIFTRAELERSADVFVIELLDMQQHHRVLLGPDALAALTVPRRRHRMQLEYELEEKLVLLRQRILLAAGDKKRTWDLLLRSLSAFSTLFRHALMVQGKPAPASKREAVQALSASLGFDASAFAQLLDIRERRAQVSQFAAEEVAARYLAAVEHVTEAVDKMADAK